MLAHSFSLFLQMFEVVLGGFTLRRGVFKLDRSSCSISLKDLRVATFCITTLTAMPILRVNLWTSRIGAAVVSLEAGGALFLVRLLLIVHKTKLCSFLSECSF